MVGALRAAMMSWKSDYNMENTSTPRKHSQEQRNYCAEHLFSGLLEPEIEDDLLFIYFSKITRCNLPEVLQDYRIKVREQNMDW